jgi:alpha-galactosidase
MSLALLRAAGTCVVLDVSGPLLPRVLHWGADLGGHVLDALDDVGAAALLQAVTPAVPRSALDEPAVVTLLPVESDGWSGAPGVAGHRAGASAHPRLRLVGPVEVEVDVVADGAAGGTVTARAADTACGIEVAVSLRLTPQGVLVVDAELTSTSPGSYDVAGLRPVLPLPRVATEVLDTTGRWCREASPQRRLLDHGTWWRPTRRGRTGHE